MPNQKRRRTAGEKSTQSFRTKKNLKKKYTNLIKKLPDNPQRKVWEKYL